MRSGMCCCLLPDRLMHIPAGMRFGNWRWLLDNRGGWRHGDRWNGGLRLSASGPDRPLRVRRAGARHGAPNLFLPSIARTRIARAAMTGQTFAHHPCHILVNGARMCLLVMHTKFGKQIQDNARLHFQLACELVDSHLRHNRGGKCLSGGCVGLQCSAEALQIGPLTPPNSLSFLILDSAANPLSYQSH